MYTGGLRNDDVAPAFIERFGKSFDRLGLLQHIFLEGRHTKLESTVRYLGIEVDDALEIAESTEV